MSAQLLESRQHDLLSVYLERHDVYTPSGALVAARDHTVCCYSTPADSPIAPPERSLAIQRNFQLFCDHWSSCRHHNGNRACRHQLAWRYFRMLLLHVCSLYSLPIYEVVFKLTRNYYQANSVLLEFFRDLPFKILQAVGAYGFGLKSPKYFRINVIYSYSVDLYLIQTIKSLRFSSLLIKPVQFLKLQANIQIVKMQNLEQQLPLNFLD